MPPRPAPVESDPFRRLVAIMERLLDPDGCPWDREQNHESLKPYVIEEAYEVCEAVDDGDFSSLREELGDLALQVVFHAAIARREGKFTIDDVFDAICAKLIRRHPHVFGDVSVSGTGQVLRNWEQIKQVEKEEKALNKAKKIAAEESAAKSTKSPHGITADDPAPSAPLPSEPVPASPPPPPPASVLDGVPKALPALTRATRVQEKAARVGFDWDKISDVWAKVEEEIREIREASEAGDPKAVAEEFGDFIFALVNLARFLNIHPEEALQGTTNKFIRRFKHIEARARERGLKLPEMTLAQMDAIWDEAKKIERTGKEKS